LTVQGSFSIFVVSNQKQKNMEGQITQKQIDEFYQELYNDPEFIEYMEQKHIEWMEGMDKYYKTLQQEQMIILPNDICYELPF
jgi:DNA-directed RNA polymerase delta subunit